MQANCIVSIGRNRGDRPMPRDEWSAFRLDVLSLFPERIFVGTGIGEYDGAKEESMTIIAPWSTSYDAAYLRAVLKSYAQKYGQECIAVTIAAPELVTP
jgi:hypothetical protein